MLSTTGAWWEWMAVGLVLTAAGLWLAWRLVGTFRRVARGRGCTSCAASPKVTMSTEAEPRSPYGQELVQISRKAGTGSRSD